MNVELAAQVLNLSVSKFLPTYGPSKAAGTNKLCLSIDMFFDKTNIRNTKSHKVQQKLFLISFISDEDLQFFWPRSVFFRYFKDWLYFM